MLQAETRQEKILGNTAGEKKSNSSISLHSYCKLYTSVCHQMVLCWFSRTDRWLFHIKIIISYSMVRQSLNSSMPPKNEGLTLSSTASNKGEARENRKEMGKWIFQGQFAIKFILCNQDPEERIYQVVAPVVP